MDEEAVEWLFEEFPASSGPKSCETTVIDIPVDLLDDAGGKPASEDSASSVKDASHRNTSDKNLSAGEYFREYLDNKESGDKQ